jgi:hypothetical protein
VPFSLALKRANYNEAEVNSRGLIYGTVISRIFTWAPQTFKEFHQEWRNGVITGATVLLERKSCLIENDLTA